MQRAYPLSIRLYVIAVCAGAALLVVAADWSWPAARGGVWNALGALTALSIIAKVFSLQLRLGAASSSVTFAPYLAAVLMLGPAGGIAVAGITELVTEAFVTKKPPIKVAHNTGKEIIATGGAAFVFLSLGGVPSVSTFDGFSLFAFIVAAVVYFLVANGATAFAVALSGPADLRDAFSEILIKDFVQNLFTSSLAPLIAFLFVQLGIVGLLLVAVPLALVRRSEQALLRLDQANQDLLELMVKSIEARDPYTSGHSLRVAMYAKALAKSIGLTSKEIELIEKAALLHDVGKIYEEFAPLLRNNRRLTPDERLLMRSHPVRSAELVRTISSLRGYVELCVRHHHESYDGGGYPDGLTGEEIPLGARIIMIADTADAMTTDRPYRHALSYDRLLAELERFSSTQFDPYLVEAFRSCTQARRLIADRLGAATVAAPLTQRPHVLAAEAVASQQQRVV